MIAAPGRVVARGPERAMAAPNRSSGVADSIDADRVEGREVRATGESVVSLPTVRSR
jgi:hypothetical protein